MIVMNGVEEGVGVTHYDVLGVGRKASGDEIRARWRKLAREYHPDRGGDAAKFARAHEAYEILSHEKSRAEYDWYLVSIEESIGEAFRDFQDRVHEATRNAGGTGARTSNANSSGARTRTEANKATGEAKASGAGAAKSGVDREVNKGVKDAFGYVRRIRGGEPRHYIVWGLVVMGLAWVSVVVRHYELMRVFGPAWRGLGPVGLGGLGTSHVVADWAIGILAAPLVEWVVRPFKKRGRIGMFAGIVFVMGSWGSLSTWHAQAWREVALVVVGMLVARRIRSVGILTGASSKAKEAKPGMGSVLSAKLVGWARAKRTKAKV